MPNIPDVEASTFAQAIRRAEEEGPKETPEEAMLRLLRFIAVNARSTRNAAITIAWFVGIPVVAALIYGIVIAVQAWCTANP